MRKRRRGAGKQAKRKEEKQRLVIRVWSMVFVAAVLLLVVASVWLWLWLDRSGGVEDVAMLKTGHAAHGAPKTPRFPSPSKEAALDLVKRALRVRDPVKVPECFRAGSMTPAEIVNFLQDMAATDGPIDGYRWQSSVDANGLQLDAVLVDTRLGDQKRNRLAFLTPDDKGRWRVDFDAFARTVIPSWGEILSGSARQGTVRIQFVRDNYFNGPFADEARWNCYRLGSPDMTDDIMGYCRKDSPLATAMNLMIVSPAGNPKGKRTFRAILEIRHVEGAGARQFEITRVLAEDWVRSPKPFDKIVD